MWHLFFNVFGIAFDKTFATEQEARDYAREKVHVSYHVVYIAN